jgi:UTP--glucose-1-phosphate uridylyltransferase
LSAASLVKDEPFIYVWGDDLVRSKTSFTKQMVDDYDKTGHLMIGVQEVPESEVNRYGIVKLEEGSMRITDIIEKPEIGKAPSRFADFGRMVLNQEIIDILKSQPLGKGNELWIVDAIAQYIKQGGQFYAKQVEDGEWMTTGDPLNYLKAILAYAMERPELAGELKSYIKSLGV